EGHAALAVLRVRARGGDARGRDERGRGSVHVAPILAPPAAPGDRQCRWYRPSPMSAASGTALKRTPLHDRHVAARARLVPFAGWEMPVQYEGVKAEHLAVRAGCGVFDVSHMGEVETVGPDATRFLQHLVTNDVEKVPLGGAQYALLCRDDGGV